MNLLSMILPGIREFRVPFTVGAIWLSSVAIVAITYPHLTTNDGFHDIKVGYQQLPNAIQLGIITGLAYGLGLIGHRLAADLAARAGSRSKARTLAMPSSSKRRLVREWLWLHMYPPVVGTEPLLSRIYDRTFHSNPTETGLRDLVDSSIFEEEAALIAMQFSENKPDQYQAYDRILAESELKRGLAAPLVGLACATGIAAADQFWSPVMVFLGLAAGLYLSARGHRESNEASRHLMTATSLGWTSGPTIASIRAALDRMDETVPAAASQEAVTFQKELVVIEAMLHSLPSSRRRTYVSKLRHPSRASKWSEASEPQRQELNSLLERALDTLNFESAMDAGNVDEAIQHLSTRPADAR